MSSSPGMRSWFVTDGCSETEGCARNVFFFTRNDVLVVTEGCFGTEGCARNEFFTRNDVLAACAGAVPGMRS
ncbi:unnamed protein product, partial [Nesidiocoris tenuis]